MKVLIFVAALLVIASCQDNANTPNILIGNWTVNITNVTATSPCCLPNGTLTFTNSGSDTITLTSTSWAGSMCGTRNSSFTEVIGDIDGSDSWNELSQGEGGIFFSDASNDTVAVVVAFAAGQDIMDILVNNNTQCNSLYFKTSPTPPGPKSANMLTMAGAGLIAVVTALLF